MQSSVLPQPRLANVNVLAIAGAMAMLVLGWAGRAAALEPHDAAQHEVSGTLAKLDIEAGKGMLMTDLQKPIFFRLDRPELFERLAIGDRITMQLDDEGRVLKVIETLPAEVHEPPPPAK